MAATAFVEPLAGVRRHCLGLGVSALRASQRGFQHDNRHLETAIVDA